MFKRKKPKDKLLVSDLEKAIAPGRAKKPKLHRPKVPDSVALDVAFQSGVVCAITGDVGYSRADMRLDHNPALVNRKFDPKTKKYDPDANDPRYLQWVLVKPHVQKTVGTKATRKGSDMHIRDHTDGLSASHRKHLDAMKRKTFGDLK